jgi:ring-1,2-phenylacetyl-CoA epoxidase subunit PaaD
MVTDAEALRRRAREAVAQVADPELPVLTIADLGILREVSVADGVVEVAITPTYLGCPAADVIAREVAAALARAGIAPVRVKTVLSPPWSSDWLTDAARRKLAECGIAPPPAGAGRGWRPALFAEDAVACPKCGAAETARISEFGATPCKALWRCRACGEPFERFKCH